VENKFKEADLPDPLEDPLENQSQDSEAKEKPKTENE
jgi:hypothetical protein